MKHIHKKRELYTSQNTESPTLMEKNFKDYSEISFYSYSTFKEMSSEVLFMIGNSSLMQFRIAVYNLFILFF